MTVKTIKAATVDQNQLVVKEITRPVATEGTIIVKNKVLGINFIDVHQAHGIMPVGPSGILGIEGAGEVVEVGKGVTQYKVGDRVLSLGGASHAEYSLITDLDIKAAKIPDHVSYETAAALGVQGLTAITLINAGYVVQKGDIVLVHAAAGGVGSLLVQLLHQKGAIIIASVGSDEKAAFVKKLGADHVINYKKENILDRVLEITKGEGVSLALDSIGGTTFEKSVKALRFNGTAISYGIAAGPIAPYEITSLYQKNSRVQGSILWGYFTTKEEANKWWTVFYDLIHQGKLNATIYKTYSLNNISQAFDDIAGGQTFGKLLVNLD